MPAIAERGRPLELVGLPAAIGTRPLKALFGDLAHGDEVGGGPEAPPRAPEEGTDSVGTAHGLPRPVRAGAAHQLAAPAPDGVGLAAAQVPDAERALEGGRSARAGGEDKRGGSRAQTAHHGKRWSFILAKITCGRGLAVSSRPMDLPRLSLE